jgi:hypothetical protein
MPQAVSTRRPALPHARSAAAIDAAIGQDNGADDAGDLLAALGATV